MRRRKRSILLGLLGLVLTGMPASALELRGFPSSPSFFTLTIPGQAAPALSPSGQMRLYFDSATNATMISENGGAFMTLMGSSGGSAPVNATYVTQSANATLTAEHSLGALTTGLLLNTVAASTGTLSAYAGTSCTNQFPRSLNASGAATCASVSLATDITGTLGVGNGGTGLTAGTSGGILGYTATGTLASSALLTVNALLLGGGAGATPTALGSLGSTATVLHGNAVGGPTFGAVVSADLNITTTSCTNQFVTALSSGAVGTCTTATLASAQFANQGTATTVLHGNAAGNPSFGAVSLTADVSGILPGSNGGTGNGFFAVAGPTTSLKTYTFPDASSTVAVTSNTLAVFAATTSAQLAGVLSDETGTGASVFAGSPALTTPAFSGNTVIAASASGNTRGADDEIIQMRRHATDCTAITDGKNGELCYEQDANTLYMCEPTAGDCDTAGEWIQTAGGGGAPTDATYVTTTANATLTAEVVVANIQKAYLNLPVTGAKLPATNPAVIDNAENNARLLYDATTAENAFWQFVMSQDYGSGLQLRVLYSMLSCTSGGVSIDVDVMAVTPGDAADINTNSFDTVNNCDDAAVPGTAGFLDQIVCSLTTVDSLTAGDYVKIRLEREVADVADTCTGDMEVVGVMLEWTKS